MSYCGEKLPKRHDFYLTRGDTFASTVRVCFNGEPGMLGSDGSVCFAVKNSAGNISIKTYGQSAQDENGYVAYGLTPSETALMNAGAYSYEVEFCFSAASVFTAVSGTITVCNDLITPEVRTNGAD